MAAVAAFDKFSDFTLEFLIGNEKVLSVIGSKISFGRPVDSHPKTK